MELEQDYHIAIVTTAALPWMTGTAVNPLLRAAHLAKAGKRVTLVVPWLHPLEQGIVFPHGLRFDSPAEQEEHIRAWLRARAGLRGDSFEITFYAGRYDADRGSILPIGDITRFIESSHCDVCVLEEPEHLTWYHNGARHGTLPTECECRRRRCSDGRAFWWRARLAAGATASSSSSA